MSRDNHAKLFTMRDRQVLVYLAHDDRRDNLLILRFRLWSDATGGPVEASMSLEANEPLTEKAVDAWEAGMRAAFAELTAEKVEATLDKMGLWQVMQGVEGPKDVVIG